jgi:hypothetical protein
MPLVFLLPFLGTGRDVEKQKEERKALIEAVKKLCGGGGGGEINGQ